MNRLVAFAFAFCLSAPVACGQEPLPVFGTTVVIPSGLKGDIYFLPRNTESVEALKNMVPKGSIYTTALNVPPQDFLLGFPGITDRYEWFAIDYSGRFWIEKPGLYRFRLVSDDGAMLYVDGQLIVDNDGVHSPQIRLGSIRLEGGMHAIRVPYFQGPANTVALKLDIAGPGEEARVFTTEEFRPPVDPETWKYSGAASQTATEPNLPRVAPARLPGPEELKKKKKKR